MTTAGERPGLQPAWHDWPETEAVVRLGEDELRMGLTAFAVELLALHPRVAARLLARLEEGASKPGAAAVGDGAAAAVLRLHQRLNRERHKA